MAKKTAMPAIRFDGFTDAWEERKLGEIANITSGCMGDSLLSAGNFRLTRIESISDGFVNENRMGFTNTRPDDCYLLDSGNILYSNINSISHMGKVAIYKGSSILYHGINLLRLAINASIFPDFLFYQLSTESKRNWAKTHANKAVSQASINQTLLSQQEIMTCNLDEQVQIGQFLTSLDRLVALHQREHDKTVNIKKALLEKMFPKAGEDKPEIRFSGFTGAWERRKLRDVAQSFDYGLNAPATEFDGMNKYLRITDIDDETHEFKNTDLTSPNIDLSTAENYRLCETDVLFARTGASVGKTYRYRKNDGCVYFAGFLIRSRIKLEYDAEFIFQNTLTTQYRRFIQITSQRSGQPGVNAQEYGEYELFLPNMDEQKQISALFAYLDRLLILHQRELVKLQNLNPLPAEAGRFWLRLKSRFRLKPGLCG